MYYPAPLLSAQNHLILGRSTCYGLENRTSLQLFFLDAVFNGTRKSHVTFLGPLAHFSSLPSI